jgi:hypothetical protein
MTPEQEQSLHQALAEFVGAFEVMFHYDWHYTSSMIGGEEPSFLQPGLSIEAESEDWGTRGALLEKYRNVVAAMKAAGLSPAFPFPLDRLPGSAERLW